MSIPRAFAKVFGVALFAAWAVQLFRLLSVSGKYVDCSCPRCGKPFHATVHAGFLDGEIPSLARCVHCGLPKSLTPMPSPWGITCKQGHSPPQERGLLDHSVGW